MSNISRGLRNCNPGNIRINKDNFHGEIQPSRDKSFKEFSNMAYGYRAMFVILDNYRKQGLNTIKKIIGRWAPPNENHTENYINSVAKWSEVNPNKELTEFSGKDYIKIISAMSRVENATPAIESDVIAGFNLQNRIKG